jgi:hypothetical protein
MSGASPIANETLAELCKKAFGPEGTITKQWATEAGNELFVSFMDAFERAICLSAPADAKEAEIRVRIVKNAFSKRYHDFEGDLMKIGLVSDLQGAGLEGLAKDVMMGKYDF